MPLRDEIHAFCQLEISLKIFWILLVQNLGTTKNWGPEEPTLDESESEVGHVRL